MLSVNGENSLIILRGMSPRRVAITWNNLLELYSLVFLLELFRIPMDFISSCGDCCSGPYVLKEVSHKFILNNIEHIY